MIEKIISYSSQYFNRMIKVLFQKNRSEEIAKMLIKHFSCSIGRATVVWRAVEDNYSNVKWPKLPDYTPVSPVHFSQQLSLLS